MTGVSSVDPRAEITAIKSRLGGLSGDLYAGIPQGLVLPVDAFGKKTPYRDFEPGSAIPAAQGRRLAAGEQGQPHIWAFQIHHFGASRDISNDLATETDMSLIGWAPTVNAGPISTFYFTIYDETAKNGETLGWITTRFYETELGQNPDFSL